MAKSIVSMVALTALVAGCAVGPDYQRQPLPLGANFVSASDNVRKDAALAEKSKWWNLFEDPMLSSLVERALTDNFDIRIALARVESSRATVRAADWNRLPGGEISAQRTRQRLSESEVPGLSGVVSDVARAGAQARWELDLFGRVRDNQFHQASTEAVRADREAVELVVTAEVATRYFEYQGLLERQKTLQASLDRQAKNIDLISTRLEHGFAGELDLRRVSAEAAATRIKVSDVEHEIAVSRHRLALVVGAMPGSLAIPVVANTPLKVAAVSIGKPEDLLRRRPDVVAAESRLQAQTASVGVAMGQYFPKLSLSGVLSFVSGNFGSLGDAGTRSWSAGPFLSIPLLSFGRIAAEVDQRRADTRGAQAAYEKAVYLAVADVEDGVARYRAAHNHLAATDERVVHASKTADLVNVRFQEGVADYLAVVDAERVSFDAQASRATSLAEQRIALVNLIKALGGTASAVQ